MTLSVSRRAFFGQAAAGAATTAFMAAPPPPPKAWIIVRVEWEYNDEFTSEAGSSAESTLYYDPEAAAAECRRRNEQFFTVDYPTPDDFEPDWDAYDFDRAPGDNEAAVTWGELRAAGFPDPFQVQELSVPEVFAHE